jgi:serine/threonine-protein kinase
VARSEARTRSLHDGEKPTLVIGESAPRAESDITGEQTARAQNRIGQELNGKWRLERMLGIGGAAAVYEATHRNGKKVAVKIPHRGILSDRAVEERFLREGYLANRVGHPGVVSVIDEDVTADGDAFLVMELLDGESVDERMQHKGGTLEPTEVLEIADQVLEVLIAAHDKGIIHRDLKPANLFLIRGGRLKVLDFGIARLHELPGVNKTSDYQFLGTLGFMPPEQARARWDEVDVRSDLWALGATLFTLLTGHKVHEQRSDDERLIAAMTHPARSILELQPELPKPIAKLIDRALKFEKDDRWPDARSMRGAVQELLDSGVANEEPRSMLRTVALACVGVVGCAAMTAVLLHRAVESDHGAPLVAIQPERATTLAIEERVPLPSLQPAPIREVTPAPEPAVESAKQVLAPMIVERRHVRSHRVHKRQQPIAARSPSPTAAPSDSPFDSRH